MTEYPTDIFERNPHSFEIRRNVDVDANIIKYCVEAIALVTRKYIIEPTSFTVDFCDVMHDTKTGLPVRAMAAYELGSNRFIFAVESEEFKRITGIYPVGVAILAGAHEAKHFAQQKRASV